jgi:hypothetical protein
MGSVMGHFARIENGTVTDVIVIANDVLGEDALAFPDTEGAGRAFIANTLRLDGEWRQTSYNGTFRYHYAGVGYTFDPDIGEHGAFIAPQPFGSWTLDENANWQPPVPHPGDGMYTWDEDEQEWQQVDG